MIMMLFKLWSVFSIYPISNHFEFELAILCDWEFYFIMQERIGKSEGGSKVSWEERGVKEGKLMKNEMKTKWKRKNIELAAGLKMKDVKIQSCWLDIKRQCLERCNNCLSGKIKQKKIYDAVENICIYILFYGLWKFEPFVTCQLTSSLIFITA